MLEQIVPLTIYGQQKNSGTLYATDAPNGQAGIGGSRHSNFTSIAIHGGHIIAKGGDGAAGIGAGGEGDREGTRSLFDGIFIYGGIVEATGGSNAAGIGGGENGSGANVNINGGTIHASAGGDDTGYRAIGPGKGSDNYGTLTIADLMMVRSERIFSEPERVNGCWYRTDVHVEPCTHPGYTADTCPYHKH